MWPKIVTTACTLLLLFTSFSTPISAQQVRFVRHDFSTWMGGAFGLDAADMDGDGFMDVLAASTTDGISWWRNRGNGTFQRYDVGDLIGAWYVHGADVDGDGDIDVMAASPHPEGDRLRLWINTGSNNWDAPIDFPLVEAEAVKAADLDGDGVMEILGISWGTNPDSPGSDLVYFKNYLGADPTKVVIDGNLLGAHDVATADYDGDGDVDVVASGAGDINIYLNDGSGEFERPIRAGEDGAAGFSLGDVDLDGDFDIITQTRNGLDVVWLENKGGWSFQTHIVGTNMGGWSAHAADLDGDGDMDITAASLDEDVVKAYINDGFLRFTEVTVAANFDYARYEYPVDVDNDGDADVVAVSATASIIAWFESIAPPKPLELTSPNGGEIWEADSTKRITWKTNGSVSKVKIELTTDGGSTWFVVAGNTPNSGAYEWKVPKVESEDCYIRISDVAVSDTKDQSNSRFRIVPYSLKLKSPNGKEEWLIGSTQTISWDDYLDLAAVDLEFSTNGGASWQTIASNRTNTGSYSWKIPNTPSTLCRVRVLDAEDGTPADVSDANFTIAVPKVLTLTAPNGGETWFTGTAQNLTWSSAGAIDNVKLELSTDNGTSWQPIVASTPNNGSHPWTIPNVVSNNCLVRISDMNDANRNDVSNAVFSLRNPFITVVSPNGEESLLKGSAESLLWSSGGPITQVKIELSRNAGSNWEVLAANAANNGSYAWTVAGTLSSNCLLRISDAADGDPKDVSDAAFAIDTTGVKIIAPNGGETLTPDQLFVIKWKTIPHLNAITLEYSTDDGVTWTVIDKNNPNLGSFGWVVPNTLSGNCRVRVSDVVAGGSSDMSDRPFQIRFPNRAPIAHAGGPYSGTRKVPINFNASQSSDPDGDPLTYSWGFGDGQTGSGMQVSHAYANLGNHTVTMTVRDGQGGQTQASTEVKISNTPPVVDISTSEGNQIGACSNPYPIKFKIDKAEDVDGTIAAYDWDFGDGSPHGNSSSAVTHDFKVPGNYTIKLRITDNDGAGAMDSVKVSLILNQPPVAAFTVSTDKVPVDSVMHFDASQSSDPEGFIASYVWDFGDGAIVTSFQPKVTHVYSSSPQNGTVEVLLTLFDSCGKSSTAKRTLRILGPNAVDDAKRNGIPKGFALAQSYPNPLSLGGEKLSPARISFAVPKVEVVRLSVYNIFGQHVRTLVNGRMQPGHYEAEWNLRDEHGKPVSVGIYFYRLYAGDYSATKKLVITK